MSQEILAAPASPGIAIAPVYHHRNAGEFVPTTALGEDQVESECDRFSEACERAAEALEALKGKVRLGAEGAGIEGIYDAHMALVRDPAIQRDVFDLIKSEKVNAEVALQRVVSRYEEVFRSIDNVTVRERAADIRDVGRQILATLLEKEQDSFASDAECVLAVDEFLPSDLALIDAHKVRGIVMGEGGRYSHGAILAKSLGIPCIVGLEQRLSKVPAGALVILDGDRGRLIVDPTEERLDRYRRRLEEREEADRRLFEVRLSPSVTRDGTEVELLANIEGLRELGSLEQGMFEGIGLFRTEFAFMERLVFPSEQEQVRLYTEVVESMGGRRVTFRMLDVGGDKPLAYLRTPQERNPVLGWRGIRLTLHWRDLFYTQLRALVRASQHGPVSVLLPMVTTIEEVREGRRILDEIVEDLREEGVVAGDLHFGIMIEVPSIVGILPHVLELCDFISIGSNDLVQYLLAVDRDNPRVANMYDPHHPGVLQVLAQCVSQAEQRGIPCSLCGEIASESIMVPLLIGMGFRQFSMAPVFLPRVKLTVRSVDVESCQELWKAARACSSASEVHELLVQAETERA